MKTKLLIALLWGAFSFVHTANAITIGKVIDSETKQEIPKLESTDGDLYINNSAIRDHIANLKKHTVIVMLQIDGEAYRGTGIAIDTRHILTVNHGAAITTGSNNYYFTEENGKPYDAVVIKNDPTHDLALLEIDKNAPDLPEQMTFATNVNIGDTVYTIGHPDSGLYSLTKGNILKLSEKAYNGIANVKIDIKIKEGNSGGFVINNQGEMVGMISSNSQVINWGYMIGFEELQTFLKEET